ncbi:MAG: NUDIX domain-containing protein [Candidatus Nealsonbacteria bacterium]
MEKPKTIGIFAGLLNREGKLLLQRRTEKGSIIPGKSYKGDWELPGGKVEEKDIEKALTYPVLFKEIQRELREELGAEIRGNFNSSGVSVYLTTLVNKERGINDWALMFSFIFLEWVMPEKLKREVVFVNPKELREIANRPKEEGQLVSGWGKRMCRMSLSAFLLSSYAYAEEATLALDEINPDWTKTEYFFAYDYFFKKIQKQTG